MRNILRTLSLGLLAAAGLTAAGQDHTIYVAGQFITCNPAMVGTPVVIEVYGNGSPSVTQTTTLTPNCNYYIEMQVPDTSGWVLASLSCGNGSFAMDSAAYSLTPPTTADVILNLTCGDPPPCHACFTLAQNGTFAATFTSCSTGGSGNFTYLWDFSGPGGGIATGNDLVHAFPGAGQYAACLNLTDANGCTSQVCHTVYVDPQGNVSFAPPGTCQACFTVSQATSGGQAQPWAVNFTNCTTGAGPFTYHWYLPDGNSSLQPDETFHFTGAGNYGVCLTVSNADGCINTFCDTLAVDTGGILIPVAMPLDCQGVANGPNMPGTPCNDGDPATVQDHWDASCNCTGIPCTPLPGTLTLSGGQVMTLCSNDTTGWTQGVLSITPAMEPVSYLWTGPGLLPSDTLPTVAPTQPGTFHLTASNACSTSGIDFVLSMTPAPDAGTSATVTVCSTSAPFNMLDALGGTPDAGGTWASGGAQAPPTFNPAAMPAGVYVYTVPGTAPCTNASAMLTVAINDNQVWYEDADGDGLGDPNVSATACEQPAGYVGNAGDACPALWGTVGDWCDDGDPLTVNDVITGNCTCTGSAPVDTCAAGFWVVQAYENGDTIGGQPIPNTLWIWNLSQGGSGFYQYLWDFGDGDNSTEAYPTHTYPGNGPYEICLTIADSEGCTDTYCDSVSVNGQGLLNALIPHGHPEAATGQPRSGFIVNVINPLTSGMEEFPAFSQVAVFPNPAMDHVTATYIHAGREAVTAGVYDAQGRRVLDLPQAAANGPNRLEVDLGGLPDGLYLLRLGNGGQTVNARFVKGR